MPDTVPNLPTEITVPLDFTPYLSVGTSNEFGEFTHEQTSFEQIILDQVARIVADRVKNDTERYSSLRKKVEERVQSIIAEKVDAHIAEILEEPRQPTDHYGAPKGEPTTLNEIILDRVTQHLNSPERDTYSRNKGKTRLQVIADEAIDRKWDDEIKKAITSAQDSVREQVATRAADVMTKAMEEMTR